MGARGVELPVIIGQAGPLNGERWAVGKPLLIGRDPECDIVIPDRQVSRYHARFTPLDDGVMLEDLGSKNGTFYEGKKVEEPVQVQDGGLVQIALVQNFVYLSSDATMPLMGGTAHRDEELEGKLILDGRARQVWVNHKEVLPPLSVPQFRLLQVLYEQQGRVVSREDLINSIWGDADVEGVSEEAVDALVRRLRDRLAIFDPEQAFIITIRGHGLRLDNPKAKHE